MVVNRSYNYALPFFLGTYIRGRESRFDKAFCSFTASPVGTSLMYSTTTPGSSTSKMGCALVVQRAQLLGFPASRMTKVE
jgi:hypothetical protein